MNIFEEIATLKQRKAELKDYLGSRAAASEIWESKSGVSLTIEGAEFDTKLEFDKKTYDLLYLTLEVYYPSKEIVDDLLKNLPNASEAYADDGEIILLYAADFNIHISVDSEKITSIIALLDPAESDSELIRRASTKQNIDEVETRLNKLLSAAE